MDAPALIKSFGSSLCPPKIAQNNGVEPRWISSLMDAPALIKSFEIS